ncbi:hypothetical protein CAPTEDRAFT_225307 [Capitella teleta]|uniref:Uncharacterized protein n=1 Tax=Capitella teleta TaxID=283909 RepID=R7T8X7_CAPTE|nr:hypothetical protein CAPTEDRAFT_225307 [Capitella teleta]|eukprot:ELT90193.1 hypothetical protein CAPTEDRAFT_225307 [Capitella teleta]
MDNKCGYSPRCLLMVYRLKLHDSLVYSTACLLDSDLCSESDCDGEAVPEEDSKGASGQEKAEEPAKPVKRMKRLQSRERSSDHRRQELESYWNLSVKLYQLPGLLCVKCVFFAAILVFMSSGYVVSDGTCITWAGIVELRNEEAFSNTTNSSMFSVLHIQGLFSTSFSYIVTTWHVLAHKMSSGSHYRRNFENWHQIQAEVQEEQQRRLRCKIGLQKELIKTQDELHHRLVRQREDAASQEREKQRSAWKAQADALQDHNRPRLQQKKKTKPKSGKSEVTSLAGSNAKVIRHKDSNLTPTSNELKPAQHVVLTSPGLSVQEEEEEEEEDSYIQEDVPWHHEQLYKLYGKKADYFLHPKFEAEKRRLATEGNPKLRSYAGRIGANYLWSSLRNESLDKLIAADACIPLELKSAYSAFVRQQLTQRRKPIKRNFYAEEDVPDMGRLTDQSRMNAAQDLKYRVDLMFRSSQTNEDRSGVLLFNNPLPTQEIRADEQGVARYMPSWLQEDHDTQEPHLSYKKWLQDKAPASRPADRSQKSQKAEPTVKLPKCVFLTEKDSKCKGEFSQRHRELEEMKSNPFLAAKRFQSALPLDAVQQVTPEQQRPNSECTWNTASGWQPLSMSALSEYSKKKPGLGQGSFSQARKLLIPVHAVEGHQAPCSIHAQDLSTHRPQHWRALQWNDASVKCGITKIAMAQNR